MPIKHAYTSAKSDGADATLVRPSDWNADHTGSGLDLLETHTASNSTSLDFTTWYSSTYDQYKIEILNLLPASNNITAQMLMSTNGGSSYDTSSIYNNNGIVWLVSVAAAVSNNSQAFGVLQTSVNNTAGYGLSMSLTFNSPAGSAYKAVFGTGSSVDASSGLRMIGWSIANFYVSATAVNAFQIKMSSGNITSGIVRVYGVGK